MQLANIKQKIDAFNIEKYYMKVYGIQLLLAIMLSIYEDNRRLKVTFHISRSDYSVKVRRE